MLCALYSRCAARYVRTYVYAPKSLGVDELGDEFDFSGDSGSCSLDSRLTF